MRLAACIGSLAPFPADKMGLLHPTAGGASAHSAWTLPRIPLLASTTRSGCSKRAGSLPQATLWWWSQMCERNGRTARSTRSAACRWASGRWGCARGTAYGRSGGIGQMGTRRSLRVDGWAAAMVKGWSACSGGQACCCTLLGVACVATVLTATPAPLGAAGATCRLKAAAEWRSGVGSGVRGAPWMLQPATHSVMALHKQGDPGGWLRQLAGRRRGASAGAAGGGSPCRRVAVPGGARPAVIGGPWRVAGHTARAMARGPPGHGAAPHACLPPSSPPATPGPHSDRPQHTCEPPTSTPEPPQPPVKRGRLGSFPPPRRGPLRDLQPAPSGPSRCPRPVR